MKSLTNMAFFTYMLVNINPLFSEDTMAIQREQSIWQTVVMVGIALLFFYVILWRPEQKRRKTAQAQQSALKKGDRVTAVGILGTVIKVQDTTVILKMYDGAKIEVLKGAISDVIPGTEEDIKKIGDS